MSAASLLSPLDSPGFAFDHDQMHRQMYQTAPNSNSFSGVPYFLYPMEGATVPAGWWNSLHAQAHSDFASQYPAIYWPSSAAINDINLVQGATQWWQFSNWRAHSLAIQALTPSG